MKPRWVAQATLPRANVTAIAAVVLTTMAISCAANVPNVPLDGAWPAVPTSAQTAHQAWTRHGELSADFQLVIAVDATLQAPPWQAATLAQQKITFGQTDAEANAALQAAQANQAGPKVALVVTTWDRKENTLDRGLSAGGAGWQIALADDKGGAWAPVRITRDRRPEHQLRAAYPAFRDFAEVYQVEFPDTAKVFGVGNRELTLRVYSARGAVILRWTST